MSDPRDDRDAGEDAYGPRNETDETTEADAGMTGDDPEVTPVCEDE